MKPGNLYAAIFLSLSLGTASAIAQGSKDAPGSLQQRGEQMKPATDAPANTTSSPSAPRTQAQIASDKLEEKGEQSRPRAKETLKSGAPTGMTAAEREAARNKERGEQMRPKQ